MENSEKILKAIKDKQKNNIYEVMAIYNAKDKYIFSMYLKKYNLPYSQCFFNSFVFFSTNLRAIMS